MTHSEGDGNTRYIPVPGPPGPPGNPVSGNGQNRKLRVMPQDGCHLVVFITIADQTVHTGEWCSSQCWQECLFGPGVK